MKKKTRLLKIEYQRVLTQLVEYFNHNHRQDMEININGKKCTTPEEIESAIGGNYNKEIKGGVTEIKGIQINITATKKDSK
jgi:hypothetical protein